MIQHINQYSLISFISNIKYHKDAYFPNDVNLGKGFWLEKKNAFSNLNGKKEFPI